MNHNPEQENIMKKSKKPVLKIILIAVIALLLIGMATVAVIYFVMPEPPALADGGIVDYSDVEQEEVPIVTPEPTILPELAEMYAQYPEVAGWITIEDTKIDYPFVYTPDDPNKYVHKAYDGSYNVRGSIILDGNCTYDPHNQIESGNLVFHGHNMNDGSMFQGLTKYKQEAYWQEHPTVTLRTLYEVREYEILAVFPDRVYYNYEDCFKFYKFTDTSDEASFNEAIAYYKEHSLYDTGVTADLGDRLITLTTCDYHTENGRFVVIARQSVNNGAESSTDVASDQTVENTESQA